MSYSIFESTMADMNYQEIEAAAKQQAIILFPIAVIEEHGPHLCLGADVYLTYIVCKKVKEALAKEGLEALIAPPFYWGINKVTGAFAGSFTVRRSTMKAMLGDLLLCLKNWGFNRIYLFNFHGDYEHIITIFESVRDSRIDLGVKAYVALDEFDLRGYGLKGDEEHIVTYQTPRPEEPRPEYMDVHAGSFETSLMTFNFPELVNQEVARTLESSKTTWEDGRIWTRGWDDARKVTPLGYCGDPANIDLEMAREVDESTVDGITKMFIKLYK
ncbi:MAG TPA: creatininase family protein [Bacillota bacterium]|nr:creatininase family protein [Bacillota bacterium]